MRLIGCKVVLMLEHDENDRFFIQRAFKENNFQGDLVILEDGQAGIDYVNGAETYRDRARYPLPDSVITDLKMPRVNGMDFLAWMKEHEDFKVIPVIVLSSSTEDGDINRLYKGTWGPLHNFFLPSAKLVKKHREGSK